MTPVKVFCLFEERDGANVLRGVYSTRAIAEEWRKELCLFEVPTCAYVEEWLLDEWYVMC